VEFLDANTRTETPKTIPLGRTADYRIVITSTPFSANGNVAPVAIITTNAQNQVSTASIKDARQLMFRLGAGGDLPNARTQFTWPGGRVEGAAYDFAGGDKAIASEKDWKNAVMTRIWELGGGDTWYAPSSAESLKLVKNTASTFASTSDNFEYVAGDLHWKGLSVIFDNSAVWKNDIADQLTDSATLTDIVAGECIYVDLDRTQNVTVTAKKATLVGLGAATTPGARFVIAWCSVTGTVFVRDFPIPVGGSFVGAAGTAANGTVRVSQASSAPTTPTVPVVDANGVLVATGLSRAQANTNGATSYAAGTLAIGTNTADNAITLGQAAAALTVNSLSTTFARIVTISSGGLSVTGGITSQTMDFAGAMTIGGTNATGLTIGKTGITTTLPGSLAVTQTSTFTGNATFNGILNAANHDTATAVALEIAKTTANAVNIGRAGIATVVKGSFEAVQAATFTGGALTDTLGPKTGGGTIAVSSHMSVTGNITASIAVFSDQFASKTAAGAMTIGTTAQTGAITMGRTGQSLTINSNLAVSGTFTPSSTLVLGATAGAGLDANGKKVTNLPAPIAGSSDAATAAYAEAKRDEAIASSNATSYANLSSFIGKFGMAYHNNAGQSYGSGGLVITRIGTGWYRITGPSVVPGCIPMVSIIGWENTYDTIQVHKPTLDAVWAGTGSYIDFYIDTMQGRKTDRGCSAYVIAPF
jgi:hypothetical protein